MKMNFLIIGTVAVLGMGMHGMAKDLPIKYISAEMIILKTSSLPDPQKADYDDCLTYIQARVENVRSNSTAAKMQSPQTILLVAWGFEKRELQIAASLKAGNRVRATLVPYASVAEKYDSVMLVDNTDDFESERFWTSHLEVVRSDVVPVASSTASVKTHKAVADVMHASDIQREAIAAQLTTIHNEVAALGGWESWTKQLKPFREDVSTLIKTAYAGDGVGCVAREGYLFQRWAIETIIKEDPMKNCPQQSDPFNVITDLNNQLRARGIDLIFVPVPAKADICSRYVSEQAPSGISVSPHWKRFMIRLLEAEVEVLDLMPQFLEARDKSDQQLFYRTDSHWNSSGIQLAAEHIANRLDKYEFAQNPKPENTLDLQSKMLIKKDFLGTLPKHISPIGSFEAMPETANIVQVYADTDTPYRDSPDSPIIIVGDSFTIFNKGYHGHLSALLARELGMKLTLLGQVGGGPGAAVNLARKEDAFWADRKVVVWIIASNYLKCNSRWKKAILP